MVSPSEISRVSDDLLVSSLPSRNPIDSFYCQSAARFGVSAIPYSVPQRSTRSLSKWSASLSKRLFDIGCVVLSLPISIPALLLTGLAVRLSSRGPVLFRQERMGCHGQSFTIYKFRTMPDRRNSASRPVVTTASNQRFTPVGPFLRRWKLDELPQLINVLLGDMSLVGPRPKVPSHQENRLNCRPGITGRATIVFAKEEVTLAHIPMAQLDAYYHGVVLPLKQMLDEDYMANATLGSDLKLILQSVFRNWDDLKLSDLIPSVPMPAQSRSSAVRLDLAHPTTVLLPSQNAMASHQE